MILRKASNSLAASDVWFLNPVCFPLPPTNKLQTRVLELSATVIELEQSVQRVPRPTDADGRQPHLVASALHGVEVEASGLSKAAQLFSAQFQRQHSLFRGEHARDKSVATTAFIGTYLHPYGHIPLAL